LFAPLGKLQWLQIGREAASGLKQVGAIAAVLNAATAYVYAGLALPFAAQIGYMLFGDNPLSGRDR
jgi:hypothetical protein